jgi:ribose 5-phosphate isomerase RpiB
MKVYIISNDPNDAIVVANAINKSGNSGIISDMRTDDPKEQLNDLKMNIDGADSAVVLCSNPKLFTIAANKMPRLRAAACRDYDDAAEAVKLADANVIVIDSTKSTKVQLAGIMDGWLGGSSYRPRQMAKPQQERQQQQPYQPQRQAQQGSGSSIFGSLKSALGVGGEEEGEEQPQRQAQGGAPKEQKKPMQMPKMPAVKMPRLNLKIKKPKNVLKGFKDALGIEDG